MRRLHGLTIVAAVAAFPCRAEPIDEPLQLGNRQPLAQIFSLPAMRSGEVLADDASAWRAAADVANNFVRAQRGGEALVLDGESQRYELAARRGLGHGLEVGIVLPWISYNGGVLDGFIDDFHRFWGLSRGGRPGYPAHQVVFSYRRNGRTELDVRDAEAGIGDIQLSAAWQASKAERSALALSTQINLPTGDADHLAGSGRASAALLFAATRERLFDAPLTLTGNIGAQWLPRGDVLGDEQKQAAWFASGELGWAVAPAWRLKTQLQIHSALYDSELRTLGEKSVQLLLGGTVRLSPRWSLDAAVGEDVSVDTAPDVTLQLALKAHF